MFKSGISVPGLILSYFFSSLLSDIYFKLIDQPNRNSHNLMKSNLVGSPSIVFHRFHKVDETYIRKRKPLTQNFAKAYLDLTLMYFSFVGDFPRHALWSFCPLFLGNKLSTKNCPKLWLFGF